MDRRESTSEEHMIVQWCVKGLSLPDDATAKTNYVHRARKVGFWFGSNFGASPTAYIYVCWVVLAPRSAVEVEAIAEEVRDLNTYRRYSDFQTEGEIAV